MEAGMAGRELEQVPRKPCKHRDLGGEAATSPEATGSSDGGSGDPGAFPLPSSTFSSVPLTG